MRHLRHSVGLGTLLVVAAAHADTVRRAVDNTSDPKAKAAAGAKAKPAAKAAPAMTGSAACRTAVIGTWKVESVDEGPSTASILPAPFLVDLLPTGKLHVRNPPPGRGAWAASDEWWISGGSMSFDFVTRNMKYTAPCPTAGVMTGESAYGRESPCVTSHQFCGGRMWKWSARKVDPANPDAVTTEPPKAEPPKEAVVVKDAPPPPSPPPPAATEGSSTENTTCERYVKEVLQHSPGSGWSLFNWQYKDRKMEYTMLHGNSASDGAGMARNGMLCFAQVDWKDPSHPFPGCGLMVFESASVRESFVKQLGDIGWNKERISEGRATFSCQDNWGNALTADLVNVGKKYVSIGK
jgi:hypothetical protein